MRLNLLPLAILIALFSLSTNLTFAQAKIYSAKVYLLSGKTSRGILKAADDKGVYLVSKLDSPGRFIGVNDIKSISIKSKKAASTGSTVGFITGLAVGTAGVLVFHSDDKLVNTGLIVGGLWTTFLGGIIGGKIGGHSVAKATINGNPQAYLKELATIRSYSQNK